MRAGHENDARRPATKLLVLCGIVFLLACAEESETTAKPDAPAAAAGAPRATVPAKPVDPKELVESGRQYYLSSCIACHNPDPTKEGALGPPVTGSSPELIEARVMRAEYPPGYTPKRDTRVMIAMPFLEKQLPALSAYLAPESSAQ